MDIQHIEKTLEALGIAQLNQMQEAAYTHIKSDEAVMLLAPTGSGKTLAFLLPIYQLLRPGHKGIQCLILTPSRELALQIEQVWKSMGTGYKVNTCYGGHSIQVEMQSLSEAPALLIGTPGRVSDHLQRQSIHLEHTPILVLDEYDKSLSLGFEEEMAFIARHLNGLQKKVLASATTLNRLPSFIDVQDATVLDFTQQVFESALELKTVEVGTDKIEALVNLLCFLGGEAALVFCNFRESVEHVCYALRDRGIEASFYHGKLEQIDREKALIHFRNGSNTILVASDLAARGLDIPLVKHVIHYEMPFTADDFTHRNGRTARMNAAGTAYLMRQPQDGLKPYLPQWPEVLPVPPGRPLPPQPAFSTLYIGGGKKDKLSKGDIAGFLMKKGELEKEEIGRIEVMDFISFVAVSRHRIKEVLRKVRHEKIKGKGFKMEEGR